MNRSMLSRAPRFFLVLLLVASWMAPALADTPLRMETRWPGVHLVFHDELELKSVVAEFEGFLAVVELPQDDATVRGLLAFLREQFPDKPVRFAFHTHHHGHSIGALDPLLASNVTVVTSPWNLGAVRERSGAPAALDDRVLTIKEQLTLQDGANELTAYVIPQEKYEVPTQEYMILHLPRAGAVVTGCLFNKPDGYYEVINDRKTSLRRFLADSALEVEWLVPTATIASAGFEEVSSFATFQETFEKGIRPWEVADRLQQRSVEQLRAEIDELVREFRELTPRSYDIMVCGHYLKNERDDVDRALVLYDVAVKLHPDEYWPQWCVATAWTQKGDTERARAEWTRALELATSDAQRERAQKQLDEL